MPRLRLFSLLLAGALCAFQGPVLAEISETEELAALQHERRQLEREAAQYRASIDLLVANGARNDSPAIGSLVRELGLLRRSLNQLEAHEAELKAAIQGKTVATNPEDLEAARLAEMLRRHYAQEQSTPKAATRVGAHSPTRS